MIVGGNWKDMIRAIEKGDYYLVEYYLRAGIDPNYQHPEEMVSPLAQSFKFNQLEIAKLLIEKGADINAKQILDGETALSFATKNKNQEALDLLEVMDKI